MKYALVFLISTVTFAGAPYERKGFESLTQKDVEAIQLDCSAKIRSACYRLGMMQIWGGSKHVKADVSKGKQTLTQTCD